MTVFRYKGSNFVIRYPEEGQLHDVHQILRRFPCFVFVTSTLDQEEVMGLNQRKLLFSSLRWLHRSCTPHCYLLFISKSTIIQVHCLLFWRKIMPVMQDENFPRITRCKGVCLKSQH